MAGPIYGTSTRPTTKSTMSSLLRGSDTTQPTVSPSQAIALRRMGWRQRADGSWYAPAGTIGPSADGGSTTTRPRPVPGDGNLSGSGVDNGGGGVGATPQSTTTRRTITPSAATTLKPNLRGGSGGGTALTPAPGGSGTGTTTTGGSSGGTGGLSSQWSSNMLDTILQDPTAMSRGVMRMMGEDPDGGYGAIIAEDLESLTPLMAFLLAEGSSTGGSAPLADAAGAMAVSRATPGGAGAYGGDIIGDLLTPTTDAARAMYGDYGAGMQDLDPRAQIDLVNQMVANGVDLGLNPWAARAMMGLLNSAGSGYLDSIGTGGAPAADPYYQFLQQRGLAGMWRG